MKRGSDVGRSGKHEPKRTVWPEAAHGGNRYGQRRHTVAIGMARGGTRWQSVRPVQRRYRGGIVGILTAARSERSRKPWYIAIDETRPLMYAPWDEGSGTESDWVWNWNWNWIWNWIWNWNWNWSLTGDSGCLQTRVWGWSLGLEFGSQIPQIRLAPDTCSCGDTFATACHSEIPPGHPTGA